MIENKITEKVGSLRNGRLKCPECGKKGVGYANHPHAYGWKDYQKAHCRYCNTRFNVGKKIVGCSND